MVSTFRSQILYLIGSRRDQMLIARYEVPGEFVKRMKLLAEFFTKTVTKVSHDSKHQSAESRDDTDFADFR